MTRINIHKLQSQEVKKNKPQKSASFDFLSKDIRLFPKKLSDKKKERFYLELGTLLEAGVDIRTGLELIRDGNSSKKDRDFFNEITSKVVKGDALSAALKSTNMISLYEFHSLEIGEETGKINETLAELAAFYKKKIQQRRQLISALTYPVIVVGFSLFAVFFLMKFVVPMFADIFQQFNGELPWLTKMVVDISNGIEKYYLYVLIVAIGLIVLSKLFRSTEGYRRLSTSILLRLPLIGGMMRKVYLARFAQSMSLLVRAKVPMLRAIGLVKQMIHFYPLQKSLEQVEKDIVKGVPLHESMSKFPIYYRKMVSLIKVGEEVNKLDEFFERISNQYSQEVDHKSKVMSSLLEPFIIIFLGLLVGVILIAMYLPMFSLGDNLN